MDDYTMITRSFEETTKPDIQPLHRYHPKYRPVDGYRLLCLRLLCPSVGLLPLFLV